MGMNYYNQGYGRSMPYPGQNHGRMPMQANNQFQRQGMHPSAFGAGSPMAQNNFRYQNPMNQAPQQMGMQGMNNMQGMNGMQSMQGMNGMQGVQGMHPSAGMANIPGQGGIQATPNPNMLGNAPQTPAPIGPVTFEPYNPAQQAAQTPVLPTMDGSNHLTGNPISAPAIGQGGSNFSADISNFIQGEKNAALFYIELCKFTKDEYIRNKLGEISDNAKARKSLLSSLYTKISGSSYVEKDTPIMKSSSLLHGLKEAVEIENNTVKELSALYDSIENGMHLKSINSLIQKKLADIIFLQQIAFYG